MLPKVVPLTQPVAFDLSAPIVPDSVGNERLMPSGIFYTEGPSAWSTPVMCNPWFFNRLEEGEPLEVSLEKPRELRARHGELVSVSKEELDSYADTITRVRAEFSVNSVDAVIVPLCGALRPASLILPMGNFDLTMLPIPFTRGSSGLFDAQILSVLGEQLAPLLNRDPLTLGILDTGIGGQSLIHMVTLLRRLHDEAAPHHEWNVHCNIVIASDNRGYLDNTNAVKKSKSERFLITRKVFPTSRLVAEDAIAAIPYKVDWRNPGAGYIEPVSTPGALVVRHPDRLEVYPTEDISRSLDHQMAEATTRALRSERNIFVGDIWEPGLKEVLRQEAERHSE
jgi:hypothetical protein